MKDVIALIRLQWQREAPDTNCPSMLTGEFALIHLRPAGAALEADVEASGTKRGRSDLRRIEGGAPSHRVSAADGLTTSL